MTLDADGGGCLVTGQNWDTGAVEGVVGSIGCRILVIGMAGAGKSTFSRALSARTGLPVIHLDFHYWKPGWVKPSEDEWREKQRGLLAGTCVDRRRQRP